MVILNTNYIHKTEPCSRCKKPGWAFLRPNRHTMENLFRKRIILPCRIQWVAVALSPGVKRPGREADHSPSPIAEVKNAWSYTSIPPYVFLVWCLVKYRLSLRENFTFTFTSIILHGRG
jgi:hypothetical protein